MKKPKIINLSDVKVLARTVNVKVIMRKDFYDNFRDHLKQISQDTGATYFGHNIIKNYGERGHTVSTFCNHENWHNIYWDKFCQNDPLEKTIHQVVLKNNLGVISWEMGHNGSACSQERTALTAVKDGIYFSFKRPDSYIETLAIGWENISPEKLDTDYISHLSSLLKPIRDYHWDVHDNI